MNSPANFLDAFGLKPYQPNSGQSWYAWLNDPTTTAEEREAAEGGLQPTYLEMDISLGVAPLLRGLTTGLLSVNLGQLSDWIRVGKTIVPNELIYGPGSKGATKICAVKGGSVNPDTGFKLPFHYHVHRYNIYKPWLWFKKTPIIMEK